jgi:hypothetical protein
MGVKETVLMVGLLTSINLHGVDRAECETLFKHAIQNFYLENSCKFDKHIAASLRREFGEKNCPELFSDADMKSLNSKVLGESYQNMKKIGRDKFCRVNRAKYDELGNLYQ